MRRTNPLCCVLLALVVCAACSTHQPASASEPWDYRSADIVGPSETPSSSISVDLYVDSTVSMQGFVGFPESTLASFVKDLEGSIGAGWTNTAVRYFKFGSKIAEWPRDKFVTGVSTPQFYIEKGIAETTNIDALIAQADSTHVSLVLTDLFQNEGDVNAMVEAIKKGFIAKGIPVGVMPVPSQFSGTVFDAKVPPFRYTSKPGDPSTFRAFYLLMFGKQADLERLVDVLGQASKVDRGQFMLLSLHPVRRQHAEVRHETLSKNLVALKVASPKLDEVHLDYTGSAEASFAGDIEIEPNQAAPPLMIDRLEAKITRRTLARRAGESMGPETPATDLQVSGPIAVQGSHAHIPLRLQLSDPPGSYAYRIDLWTPSVRAFGLPKWVGVWSSENPTPTVDPNKTINLARFINGMVQASASVHQVPVGRLFIQIRKK